MTGARRTDGIARTAGCPTEVGHLLPRARALHPRVRLQSDPHDPHTPHAHPPRCLASARHLLLTAEHVRPHRLQAPRAMTRIGEDLQPRPAAPPEPDPERPPRSAAPGPCARRAGSATSSRRAPSRSCSSRSSASCSLSALRPVDRRRRHVADADGRPRGDRPRAPAHGAHLGPWRGSDVDRPAVARPGRLLRGARARRDARRDPPRDRPRPARARPRYGDRADERRVFALDVPGRLARGARRPLGVDDPRADRRVAALRRRSLAPCRRLPPRHPPKDAARASAARRLGEPPRLGRARRGPHRAPRRDRARPRPAPRLDAGSPSSSSRRSASSPRPTGRSWSPTTT